MATLKKHFWGAREELQQACHQSKHQQLSAENIEPEDGFGRHDKSCQNWTCGNHTHPSVVHRGAGHVQKSGPPLSYLGSITVRQLIAVGSLVRLLGVYRYRIERGNTSNSRCYESQSLEQMSEITCTVKYQEQG